MIILLAKYDLDAAYQRLSVVPPIRPIMRNRIFKYGLICFRLPLGSKPAPALFSLVSEFNAELAQCLTKDTSWEPSELHSDMLGDIDTSPIYSSGKFGQADPLMIHYEPRNLSI